MIVVVVVIVIVTVTNNVHAFWLMISWYAQGKSCLSRAV